ncbi:hypothetical protein EIP86_003799 [Pleurotus ostreatoroseus]|nr:hypothetical protein EIP86_003799 [Pleurotus ostreatoroseus]
MLSPTVLYSLMTELLTLLAHVDCVRSKFLARLDAITTWDDHFKLAKYREADIKVLDNQERRIVEQAKLTLGDSARRSYRSIVLKYSQLAIYETWISHRWTETRQALDIYYPPPEQETPEYLFHDGLSAAEKQELNASYNNCLELVKKWARESAGYAILRASRTAKIANTLSPIDADNVQQQTNFARSTRLQSGRRS